MMPAAVQYRLTLTQRKGRNVKPKDLTRLRRYKRGFPKGQPIALRFARGQQCPPLGNPCAVIVGPGLYQWTSDYPDPGTGAILVTAAGEGIRLAPDQVTACKRIGVEECQADPSLVPPAIDRTGLVIKGTAVYQVTRDADGTARDGASVPRHQRRGGFQGQAVTGEWFPAALADGLYHAIGHAWKAGYYQVDGGAPDGGDRVSCGDCWRRGGAGGVGNRASGEGLTMEPINAEGAAEFTGTIYQIPDCNLDAFQDRIRALQRRALRLGCNGPGSEVVGRGIKELRQYEPADRESGRPERWIPRTVRYTAIRIFGQSPRVNGFRFAAKLTPAGNGSNVIKAIPGLGVALPERFRASGMTCDHCRTVRIRSDVFVLLSDGGTFHQVGRTCLADFLGHPSPETLAAGAEMLADACDAGGDLESLDPTFGSGGRGLVFPMDRFLSVVAALIRVAGFVSRKAGTIETPATADDAVDCLEDMARDRCALTITDADRATGAAALDWARNLSGGSDFDHNLRTVAAVEFVGLRNIGIAAYIVAGYLREVEKARKAGTERSEWIGKPGDKIRTACEVVAVRPMPDSLYGSTLVKFRDPAGNLLSWFQSGSARFADGSELAAGMIVNLTATVKACKEFRDVKETQITRGKITGRADPERPHYCISIGFADFAEATAAAVPAVKGKARKVRAAEPDDCDEVRPMTAAELAIVLGAA